MRTHPTRSLPTHRVPTTSPLARASATPTPRSANRVSACTASRIFASLPASIASGPISPSISAPTSAGVATAMS